MSGLYRLLSIVLAIVVAFLLYQSRETKKELEDLASRIESSQTAETEASSWDNPDFGTPYPESIPQEVASLIDAYEPLDGKYDLKRIKKVMEEISDKNLKDVLDSIDWQSDIGKEMADELLKRKAINPEMFKDGNITFDRGLKQIRYLCSTDPLCIDLFQRCCLSVKCCIYNCCQILPCKRCCYSCWSRCCSSCCSKTVLIGIKEGTTGTYITAKKILFDNTFIITQDGDTAKVELRKGTGTETMTQDNMQGLADHLGTIQAAVPGTPSYNPHGIVKADILYGTDNPNDGIVNPHTLITETEIMDETITHEDLGTDSVDYDEIKADAVRNAEIQTDAVNSAKIEDGTVTVDDLGTDSVDFDEIKTNAVRTEEIQNETIRGEDISSDLVYRIPETKLNFAFPPAGHKHHGEYLVPILKTNAYEGAVTEVAALKDGITTISAGVAINNTSSDLNIDMQVDNRRVDDMYIYSETDISPADFAAISWAYYKKPDVLASWSSAITLSPAPVYDVSLKRINIQIPQPATTAYMHKVVINCPGCSGAYSLTEVTAENDLLRHSH